MDALGVSSAHVLGISMGGMIAQELVLNYPTKVDDLILLSTDCGGSYEEVIDALIPPLFIQESIEDNLGFIEQQMLKNPISVKDFNRQIEAIFDFDTYDRLDQIESRTLILRGKKDILIPPENGEILEEAIPNSRLVYFEDSAHRLIEEMDEVVDTILGFFR